jgi:hypothetical protein
VRKCSQLVPVGSCRIPAFGTWNCWGPWAWQSKRRAAGLPLEASCFKLSCVLWFSTVAEAGQKNLLCMLNGKDRRWEERTQVDVQNCFGWFLMSLRRYSLPCYVGERNGGENKAGRSWVLCGTKESDQRCKTAQSCCRQFVHV